jgi:hypothetical protein
MGGIETYVLGQILVERHADILRAPAPYFAMIELEYGDTPYRPHDDSFVETWRSRVVLAERLPD